MTDTPTLAARVADALALAPQRVHAERDDGRYGACHTCGQRTHLFDDLECGGCKDEAYLAEWQGYAGTLGTLVRDLAAALAAAGAREARLAEALREAHREDSYGLILTNLAAQVARLSWSLPDEAGDSFRALVRDATARRDALRRAALEADHA